MVSEKKRIRRNEMNIQWVYAKQCWDALKNGQPLPPIPKYQVYESYETGGKETLVGEKLITPMKIVYGGEVYFGE